MRLIWVWLIPNAPVSFGTITVVNESIWAARIGTPAIRFTEPMVLTVVEPIGPLIAAGSPLNLRSDVIPAASSAGATVVTLPATTEPWSNEIT